MNAAPAALARPSAPWNKPGTLLSLPVRKEIRALLPFWLLTVLVPLLGASVWLGTGDWAFGVVVFFLGCMTMACQTFGQELTHHTAPQLLSQPITRRQLWKIKMGVLAVALATAAAAMITGAVVMLYGKWLLEASPLRTLLSAQNPGAHEYWGAELALSGFALLGALCCFCTTPWLTLYLRHNIAAAVSSVGIPLALWGLAYLLALVASGPADPSDAVAVALFALMLSSYCIAGLVSGYRRFLHWEDLEGSGGNLSLHFRWPAWSSRVAGAALHRRPLLQLFVKEVRLQQWSLLVAGASLAFWLALVLAKWAGLGLSPEWFPGTAVTSGVIISLIPGALCCAEERQLGTLESQLALGASIWKQFLIKAAAALAVVLALGVGLPLLQLWAAAQLGFLPFHWAWEDLVVLLVCTGAVTSLGIYASSIAQTTIRAMSLFVALLVFIIWLVVQGIAATRVLVSLWFHQNPPFYLPDVPVHVPGWFWLCWLVLFSFALLALAYANFRRTGHRPARFFIQAAALASISWLIYSHIYLWDRLGPL